MSRMQAMDVSYSGSTLLLNSPYATDTRRKRPSVGVKAGKTKLTMKLSTASGRKPCKGDDTARRQKQSSGQ